MMNLCDENENLKLALNKALEGCSSSSCRRGDFLGGSSSDVDMEKELNAARTEVAMLTQIIADMKEYDGDAKPDVFEELKLTKKELKLSKAQADRLKADVTKMEAELSFYKSMSDQDKLQDEMIATREALTQSREEVERLKRENEVLDELHDVVEGLEQELKEAKTDKEGARERMRLEKEVLKCRERISQLEIEIKATLSSLAKSHAAVSKAEKLHESELNELRAIIKGHEEKHLYGVDNEAQVSGLQNQLLSVEEELSGSKTQLGVLTKENEDLKFKLHEMNIQHEETKNELDISQKVLRDTEKGLIEALSNNETSDALYRIKELQNALELSEHECSDLRVRLAANQEELEKIKLSSGQKELITSLIFNLKSEIADLKAENSLLKSSVPNGRELLDLSQANTALIATNTSPSKSQNLIEPAAVTISRSEADLRQALARAQHDKEMLEKSHRSLETSLAEKEFALTSSQTHADMLREVINQLQRTHVHVDMDESDRLVDFKKVRSSLKIATYHSKYLAAIVSKRLKDGEKKRDGDDLIDSLTSNIDELETEFDRLQHVWVDKEQTFAVQIKSLKEKLATKGMNGSPLTATIGATGPLKVLNPSFVGLDKSLQSKITDSPDHQHPLSPPSPSVPQSPALRLLMEMHEQLDEELRAATSPTSPSRRLNLVDRSEDDIDCRSEVSITELNDSLCNFDASFNAEITRKDLRIAELTTTVEEMEAALVEREIQCAQQKAIVSELNDELEGLKKDTERARVAPVSPVGGKTGKALIDKLDEVNANWIETQDQAETLAWMQRKVAELELEADIKDQAIHEASEQLVSQKELFKYKEEVAMKKSHEIMKKLATNYDAKIFELREQILLLQIEVHKLRHISGIASFVDSTMVSSDVDSNVDGNTKDPDLVEAKKELERLQTQLAILQQSKMIEGEKHMILSQVYKNENTPSFESSDINPVAKRSPSRDQALSSKFSAEEDEKELNLIKSGNSPKRNLASSEAAMQIAIRNNSRAVALSEDMNSVDGTGVLTTPRGTMRRKGDGEQDCAVALGCSPS